MLRIKILIECSKVICWKRNKIYYPTLNAIAYPPNNKTHLKIDKMIMNIIMHLIQSI